MHHESATPKNVLLFFLRTSFVTKIKNHDGITTDINKSVDSLSTYKKFATCCLHIPIDNIKRAFMWKTGSKEIAVTETPTPVDRLCGVAMCDERRHGFASRPFSLVIIFSRQRRLGIRIYSDVQLGVVTWIGMRVWSTKGPKKKMKEKTYTERNVYMCIYIGIFLVHILFYTYIYSRYIISLVA